MRVAIYSTVLAAIFAIGSAYHFLNELILYRAGEDADLARLIENQRKNDGLYNGLAVPIGDYKLTVYAQRRPDIVLLGSSRALYQHQEYYSFPFYSMGGVVYGTNSALRIMDMLLALHRPRMVVYNVDYFDFCTHFPHLAQQGSPVRPTGRMGLKWGWIPINRFSVLAGLVARREISVQIIGEIFRGHAAAAEHGVAVSGINAMQNGAGLRLDGSFVAIRSSPKDDLVFQKKIEKIPHGTDYFESGCLYSRASMAYLEMLRDEMAQRGIKLVLIFAPLAPAAHQALLSAGPELNGYVRALKEDLKSRQFSEVHFFLDGASVGATDIEFADEIHAGDVAEARVLLAASSVPGSALADAIKRPVLESFIQRHARKSHVSMDDLWDMEPTDWGAYGPAKRPHDRSPRSTGGPTTQSR